jgi:heat shock protein HslJ
MKKLYTLILLATLNFSDAQDPQIFNNTWYLQHITVDGVTTVAPTSNITLNFSAPNSFITSPCNYLAGLVLFENNNTGFSISNYVMSLIICPNQALQNFEDMYFLFFSSGNGSNPANFTYSIIDSNSTLTLIVNSAFNKQAVYGNSILSNEQYDKVSFNFYPNPSEGFIEINLKNTLTSNTTLEIYNEIGILHKTEKITATKTQIDTNDLASGIYFLKITSENGTSIKKLIKK